ncbi:MAG: hypothetical protein HUJ98_08075, partial [Bacteroidaceae bacterium]|nr:hypothetical protein [Bacteroidaceae bacterium]MCF0186428.1 hypothetical protein [Bacteroidaceae bacterium]
EGGITYFNYTVTANGGDVVTPTTQTERTIKFNLPSAQTVTPGSSIKLTAILPPIAINSTDKLTIKVNATGDVSNKAIFAPATAVTASQKVMIATKNWKRPIPIPEGAVDLGLLSGNLWASCNLGATKPEEYGDYYGWGCIEPYTNYKQAAWEPYFTAIGGSGKEDSDCGTDNDPLKTYVVNVKSISGTEWDAAKHKLGDKWRMPTYEEMGELINSKDLYWSIDNLNGVKGYKITSYITGNYIFLPYAGSFQPSDPDHKGIGKYAHYWVARSSAKNDNTFYKKGAINLSLDNQEHIRRDAWRYFGFSIRPVYPSKES